LTLIQHADELPAWYFCGDFVADKVDYFEIAAAVGTEPLPTRTKLV
jgi:hypothetical protein